LEFCLMAPSVIGIDNNPASVKRTKMRLGDAYPNCKIILGNSPDILAEIIKTGIPDQTLFFLDAHWGQYWPLPDEVRTLPRGKGIIVVHDIKVPGKLFGFDYMTCADGVLRSFEYSLIEDVLTEWSPTHRIEYNDELGHSHGRGVAFIYPR
jgi:predicted O-methyltransferase YrrM